MRPTGPHADGLSGEALRRTLGYALVVFVCSVTFFATVLRFEPPFASDVHATAHAAATTL